MGHPGCGGWFEETQILPLRGRMTTNKDERNWGGKGERNRGGTEVPPLLLIIGFTLSV